MTPRHVRFVRLASFLLVAACGGESGSGVAPTPKNQLRIISGSATSDTIQTALLQPLVIEVDVGGVAAAGISVTLDAMRSSDSTRSLENAILIASTKGGQSSPSATATTDASGRVSVWPVLGTVAAEARLVISAPSLTLTDTARFSVTPGATVAINLRTRDTTVAKSAKYAIGAAVLDRFNNRRTPSFSMISGVGSVDVNGVVNAGTTVGRVVVLVREGAKADTAYSTVIPDDLFLIHQGTSYFRARLDLTQRTEIVNSFGGYAVLSPDGHTLALIISTFNPLSIAESSLYVVDARTPSVAPKRLVPLSTLETVIGQQFSQDGQWIYFSGSTQPLFRYLIWRVKVDGTQLEQVAPSAGHQFDVAISPDGTLIAWSAPPDHVMVMNLVSGTKTDVMPAGGAHPTFSPDGKRVAIARGNLAVVNVDGTDRQFYESPIFGFNSNVCWTKDGQWVISTDNSFTYMINMTTHEVVPVPGVRYLDEIQLAP
jgi:WD40-like Beta Propeller Repeat